MSTKRTLKVVIIGDGSAGKTSLRSRYLHNSFQKAYISTIGTDFVSRTIEVSIPVPRVVSGKGKDKDVSNGDAKPKAKASSSAAPQSISEPSQGNGNAEASTSAQPMKFEQEVIKVQLQIWDTAGQERFKSLGSAFYRGSDAVIIAFDLNAKGALARTINWFNDFCRLGDIAYEEEGMNVRQLKKAREQREQFCWVGVGCKADLLVKKRDDDEEQTKSDWRGTSWPEARGWFDTILPRYVPEGAEERQGYRGESVVSAEDKVMPYKVGEDVPARPEDVLSRPNRTNSISIPGISIVSDGHLSRPSEAGLAPGTAPTPGTATSQRHSRRSLGGSKTRKGRNESRKSIRSIEVWQHDQPFPSSGESKASRSTSAATMRGGKHDGTPRSRFGSAASIGASSIYYSVRGSTLFGHSPAGGQSALGVEGVDDASFRSDLHIGERSVDSQSTSRNQSRLSQIAGEDESNGSKKGSIRHPDNVSQRTHSSSDTIRGANGKAPAPAAIPLPADSPADVQGEDSLEDDPSSVPTIPSGDPIPFPRGDDFEEDDDDDTTQHEVPVRRRASRRQKATSMIIHDDVTEGEVGRKAKAIAREAQDQRLESEEEHRNGHAEVDKRATLYSARPSSISSTVKDAHEVGSEQDSLKGEEEDPGVLYRDQMIEQGFRLFFTSAKEGHGIDEVFEHIARRVAIRWKLEEWEEQREQEMGLVNENGQVQTAPPTDDQLERERIKRAIKISSGKGTGNCCF